MAKKPRTALISALSHHIPQSEWTKAREKERISYPEGPPDRASWKTPGTYEPKELQYRGQQERKKPIFLAGRDL